MGDVMQGEIGRSQAEQILNALKQVNIVLGVLSFEKQEAAIPAELQEAFDKRQKARQEKNWKEADRWRDFIQQGGYVIEDTPQGSRLKKQ